MINIELEETMIQFRSVYISAFHTESQQFLTYKIAINKQHHMAINGCSLNELIIETLELFDFNYCQKKF